MAQGEQEKHDEPHKTPPEPLAAAAPKSGLSPADRLMLICLGLGGWGVMSGYALFILLRQEIQTRTPWASMAALVAAAGVAWLTETVRQRIEPESKHPHARLPVMILMLGMFELFVSAWHGVWELGSSELVDSGLVLLGDELSSRLNAQWALVALAVLWIVEGASLAAVLGTTVFKQKAQAGQSLRDVLARSMRNGGVGALAGAIAGALGVILTVLVMRIAAGVHFIATQPQQWIDMVQRAGASSAWPAWILYKPVEYLSRLWTWNWYGPILTIVIVVLLFSYCRSEKKWWPLVLLIVGMSLLILSPLLDNLGTVCLMVFLGALVWAVPGALLGASVPLLKGPAARTQFWSVAGFLAAAILGAVAILRGSGPYLALELVACALALAAGIVFWRGGSLAANWPLAALVLALFVGMATRVQQATFQGVLENLSYLVAQPMQKGAPPAPPSPLDHLDRLKNLRLYTPTSLPVLSPIGTSQPSTLPSIFHFIGPPATQRFTLPAQPSTSPSLGTRPQPSATFRELMARLTTQPATAPSQDTWRPKEPFVSQRLEDMFVKAKTISPSAAAANSLWLQIAQADNDRQQAERLLADDHVLRDYLDDIKRRLDRIHEQQKRLNDALAEYRKNPLSATDPDPDKWPDRRGAVALLRLAIMEHRLAQQARRVEELLQKRSPLLSIGQTFELTVTASLAFWVTVGLLIGWSQRDHET